MSEIRKEVFIKDTLLEIKEVISGKQSMMSEDLAVALVQLGFVCCETKKETENFLNNAINIMGRNYSLDKVCNSLPTNKKVRELKTINGVGKCYNVDMEVDYE